MCVYIITVIFRDIVCLLFRINVFVGKDIFIRKIVNKHHNLSVHTCALLHGFSEWKKVCARCVHLDIIEEGENFSITNDLQVSSYLFLQKHLFYFCLFLYLGIITLTNKVFVYFFTRSKKTCFSCAKGMQQRTSVDTVTRRIMFSQLKVFSTVYRIIQYILNERIYFTSYES